MANWFLQNTLPVFRCSPGVSQVERLSRPPLNYGINQISRGDVIFTVSRYSNYAKHRFDNPDRLCYLHDHLSGLFYGPVLSPTTEITI